MFLSHRCIDVIVRKGMRERERRCVWGEVQDCLQPIGPQNVHNINRMLVWCYLHVLCDVMSLLNVPRS